MSLVNQNQLSRRNLIAKASLLGLAASSSLSVMAQSKTKKVSTPAKGAPNLAIVFGSGSAKGFAHIGVIKAFEEAGIEPNLIVGTSAGALVGGLWAAGYNAAMMEDYATKVKEADIIDLSTTSKRGIVSGDTFQNYLNTLTKKRTIEQLNTRFTAVTTSFKSGDPYLFNEGDLAFAIRASCSIPGVFNPAKLNGTEYVDGGLVSPVPVKVAKDLGASFVIAVDVNRAPLNTQPVGIFEQIMHSFDVMGRSLAKLEAAQADILIQPNMSGIAGTDFNSRSQAIQLGYVAAKRLMPVIIDKLVSRGFKVST